MVEYGESKQSALLLGGLHQPPCAAEIGEIPY